MGRFHAAMGRFHAAMGRFHAAMGRFHAAMGRFHAAMGRFHAAMGRFHAAMGRFHAAISRRYGHDRFYSSDYAYTINLNHRICQPPKISDDLLAQSRSSTPACWDLSER